jgi:type I restriction enzyme S subunit
MTGSFFKYKSAMRVLVTPPAYRLTADFGRLADVPIGESFCSENVVMPELTDYVKTAEAAEILGVAPKYAAEVGPGRGNPDAPQPGQRLPPVQHFVKPNDLLFSRANTSELVGAVAYVSDCPPNLLLPDKLWRFVWKNPDTIHPLFIWFLFQSGPARREIGNRATGTSGSMKSISKAKLNGIPTILPPFATQKLFADRVGSVEKTKNHLRKSLIELEQLFASLQHRAFRGEP